MGRVGRCSDVGTMIIQFSETEPYRWIVDSKSSDNLSNSVVFFRGRFQSIFSSGHIIEKIFDNYLRPLVMETTIIQTNNKKSQYAVENSVTWVPAHGFGDPRSFPSE